MEKNKMEGSSREERIRVIKKYECKYIYKVNSEGKMDDESVLDDELYRLYSGIIFEKSRRMYLEDLSERDYVLENCTPYRLYIGDEIIEDGSWGDFLCKIVNLLLEVFPEKKEGILDFRTSWTKAAIFTEVERTNFKPIKCGLFLNCNHTALHACWLLQDILDYFGINKSGVTLLIHRSPSVEPVEFRNYIERRFKRGFFNYIKNSGGGTEEKASRIIMLIEKYLNPMLAKMSKSYNNFFLFDNNTMLANYIKGVRQQINFSQIFNEKARGILNKCLDWLFNYYKL